MKVIPHTKVPIPPRVPSDLTMEKNTGKSRWKALIGWTLAILFSALLNITLFGLMPGLIHMIPQNQDDLEDIKAIQVIRVKHQETPPRKKELKKPEPKQEPRRVKTTTPTRVMRQKPMQLKPHLPFQLNPKLPTTPSSLAMPPMENFSMAAPTLKGIYEMGELDNPLTPLVKIPPLYPMRAMRRGIEGWVKVRFQVNTQGRVEQPIILESNPKNVFDQSVINCISQWKFKPGTVEGIPVDTLAETTIRFELEK